MVWRVRAGSVEYMWQSVNWSACTLQCRHLDIILCRNHFILLNLDFLLQPLLLPAIHTQNTVVSYNTHMHTHTHTHTALTDHLQYITNSLADITVTVSTFVHFSLCQAFQFSVEPIEFSDGGEV